MAEIKILDSEPATLEEVQKGWHDMTVKVGQLEAENKVLEHENKALRQLLERAIDHRQKSHSELVILLTALVSKLPINDIGIVVSKLVEHNTNVSQYLSALIKGTAEVHIPQPIVLKTWDQTKRELLEALKPIIEEVLRMDTPLEPELLRSLATNPELFFSPPMVRANRCFIKGQVPRERILREYGQEALLFFNDLTTDPKLNPRPKPEEMVLGFRNDFEAVLAQNQVLSADKRQELVALYRRIQRSKAPTEEARAQRIALQRLSFTIELLHYYEHQNTEPVDVMFAQRLPALIEQLVVPSPQDRLEEKLVALAERLLVAVINPDHRLMIINNLGKGGGVGKTLKFVMRLRAEKVSDLDHVTSEFVRHLIPTPPQKANPEVIAAYFKLLPAAMQRVVTRAVMHCEKLRKDEAEALGKGIGSALGLTGLDEPAKGPSSGSAEVERQVAWMRIKELIGGRKEASAVAAAIRERLNAKYDADEIKQSWIILTEADPMSLIKIFCHMPYLANGKTDSIARPVMETYVSRLTHEKYAPTYHKVVNSLKTLHHAKPDSPTLVNFIALVRWVDPAAAAKMCADVGMPAHG